MCLDRDSHRAHTILHKVRLGKVVDVDELDGEEKVFKLNVPTLCRAY